MLVEESRICSELVAFSVSLCVYISLFLTYICDPFLLILVSILFTLFIYANNTSSIRNTLLLRYSKVSHVSGKNNFFGGTIVYIPTYVYVHICT